MLNPIKQAVDEWDPMDLFPLCPPDEYDSEVAAIAEQWDPQTGEEALSAVIARAFPHYFGEPFSPEQCRTVAARILELSGRHSQSSPT